MTLLTGVMSLGLLNAPPARAQSTSPRQPASWTVQQTSADLKSHDVCYQREIEVDSRMPYGQFQKYL